MDGGIGAAFSGLASAPYQPKRHDHDTPRGLSSRAETRVRGPAVTGSCPARYLARCRDPRLLTVQVSAWLSSVLRIVVRYANNFHMCAGRHWRRRIPMRPNDTATTGFTALEPEEKTWALRERAAGPCLSCRSDGGRC